MKKVKAFTLSTAVIVATIAAFATSPKKPLHKQSLYHRSGGGFAPVSPGYYCTTSYDTCSYTLENGTYYPNELGDYHGQ
ncbi:hypothetical protein Q4E93_21590 [Flavitalea sp. BT771]|uniref:hypothetical protein n=1 Tax=Flavitalea sp. BT771 TaxID=3063329 RepID=UPI0026E29729|nr:hypothetical protein [Flavitalea sp. BT771]MDO6433218.1 hypothetical protein [Flavitalea sp. BT771]MDV6221506.1 hypothetical protein [Flavitalea sp. BT771]